MGANVGKMKKKPQENAFVNLFVFEYEQCEIEEYYHWNCAGKKAVLDKCVGEVITLKHDMS